MASMDVDDVFLLGLEDKTSFAEAEESQQLKLALQKRQIISEEIGRLQKIARDIVSQDIQQRERVMRRTRGLEEDPFIKFYLRVYRELCGKWNISEISKEAAKRWSKMKRKPKRAPRNQPGGTAKGLGFLWGVPVESKAVPDKKQRDQEKVRMALMKNKIVSEEVARLCNFVKKMRKKKRYSNPFIKIYLNVYREMCGKNSDREMKGEAAKRWIMAREKVSARRERLKRELQNCREDERMKSRYGNRSRNDKQISGGENGSSGQNRNGPLGTADSSNDSVGFRTGTSISGEPVRYVHNS